jgi:ribosomal protein S18 acetylase RimI-like enzyme
MIRTAQPTDTPRLLALTAGTGVFKPHEIEVLEELLGEYHAGAVGEEHTVVVLVDGPASEPDSLLGYAYYAPDVMTDRTWYLYWIAVEQQRRGAGLGTQILRYVEEDIRQRRGRVLFIETSSLPHSELTRRFYLKQGYQIDGLLRDFYSDGDDMVIFRKRLLPRSESERGDPLRPHG